MASDKVGEGGQVALPAAFLEAAGIKPGDFVGFRVTGPISIELSFYHRLTVDELFEKYRIDGPVDLAALRKAMDDELAEEIVQELKRNVGDAERRGNDRHDQNRAAASAAAGERPVTSSR